MQKRHLDRRMYFEELADTSREFYVDYLSKYKSMQPGLRVLEIGCGEGGNLLPFVELGCEVVGIDIAENRIEQAKIYFKEVNQTATFICCNFITMQADVLGKFDIVLVHDVIEHIHKEEKLEFVQNIKRYLADDGLIFFAFPAWQMPFGGHQQICEGFASKLPFIHVLPNMLYKGILKLSGESKEKIEDLLDIKKCRMQIEPFESIVKYSDFKIKNKIHWFINPHYKRKFGLKPRKVYKLLSKIYYFRNFYTTSTFYLLEK